MRYKGKIKSWKDDKGFGFITPMEGVNDVFVHISGFSNHGRRPTAGDIVTYQVTQGNDNRIKAVNVLFAGEVTAKLGRNISSTSNNSLVSRLISIAIVGALATYGYQQFSRHKAQARSAQSALSETEIASAPMPVAVPESGSPQKSENARQRFACEGKHYCSEMSSYEEALFYLRNCPDTKMDGNHDGEPCEQQFSR